MNLMSLRQKEHPLQANIKEHPLEENIVVEHLLLHLQTAVGRMKADGASVLISDTNPRTRETYTL